MITHRFPGVVAALYTLLAIVFITTFPVPAASQQVTSYASDFFSTQLADDQPAFVALSVDSLGKHKLLPSPLRAPPPSVTKFRFHRSGDRVEYRVAGASPTAAPAWSFEFSTRTIRLCSSYSPQNPPPPLLLNFNPHLNRATLLGLITDDGSVRLPAILHLPDRGTFRITSSNPGPPALPYDAVRQPKGQRENDYVRVTIPSASADRPELDYTLEVVEIHPGSRDLAQDPRFDGFRRNWLNIFQLNPRRRALANHAASDVVAFTLFEYSSIAKQTPPLARGLTALDLIRQTLDRYLGGMKGYGIVDYLPNDRTNPFDYTDTYPSLLMAAWDYVDGSKDTRWLNANYSGIKSWASKLLAMDADGDGLIEYPVSGNSGIWDKKFSKHAANWWDDIGFGHKDAYANALAYRALLGMASMSRLANMTEDSRLYDSRAETLRSIYFDTFYNPQTGVLGGWRSADGYLHDYYFTFVNSVAITCGLIPPDKANTIMDHLLAKMKQVGYAKFEYGLPGNLIPIRKDDYLESRREWGGGEKDDGSDGFQIYENGGATACYAYYTIQALYQLGRHADADAILFSMLKAFDEGGFQGGAPNGRTYDWKAWDGTPYGYEGLLVDGYQALLAVLSR
jgi:hypothetical protein